MLDSSGRAAATIK